MLLRFDPFREVDRMFGDFDRTFNRGAASMPMDAVRSENQIHISFDLPGYSPDDIDLTVERDVLTVTATRTLERDDKVQVLANERPSGTVTRRVLLGESLDTSKLEANYDQGVLIITIPVAEEAKPRKVAIESTKSRAAIDASSRES
jgi:HSP20 family protein